MTAPAILGVTRARPRIDLGVGDSRTGVGLGQWQPAGGNAANTRWQSSSATTSTSSWNGEEPYWVDITCYGIEIETYVGRDRAVDQWEVGTATVVLDNANGWADYPPTVDPNPFSLTVRPGRQIRISIVVDDGPPRVLWRGFIDQANPGFDAEEGDTVTLECIDAKGEIGRVDIAAVDPPVGAGETLTERLERICAGADYETFWQNFDVSSIALVGTGLGAQAADLLNRAADSGGGALYGDVDGKLRYRSRDWQLWPADEYEDGAIGNYFPSGIDLVSLVEDPPDSGLYYDPSDVLAAVEDPPGSGLYEIVTDLVMVEDPKYSGLYAFGVVVTGDYCPTSWEMSFAREDITTRVLIGRRDMDTPIQLDDLEAQVFYGIEPLNRTDVETISDVEMELIANRLLVTRGHTTMPLIAGVTLNAATDPKNVDLLSTADPRTPSRYRCRHISGDRQVFSRMMFCTAIRHTIGPDLWEEARLSLDDALPWQITTTGGPGEGGSGEWANTETAAAGHWEESLWATAI